MINLDSYIASIEDIDTKYGDQTLAYQNNLTKPMGSLGKLERLSIEMASITRTFPPVVGRKVIFTLAGDHGIVEEGVSAFPQEVTGQMVLNFLSGGAAINVLARHAGAEVIIVNLGVKVPLDTDHPNYRDKKIADGTNNMAKGPAMSREEALRAIEAGIQLFEEEHRKNPISVVGTGEMGIGNTTPATAILSVIAGISPAQVVGRGTGIDDEGLKRKVTAIETAIAVNQPDKNDGLDILAKVGGYEIAGLAGVILAAAKHHVPVMVDGFISTSAALIASVLNPKTKQYMIPAHQSQEPGHQKMLELLGKQPLLDLDLRLGEGTGAALAMQLLDASIKIVNEMATFVAAGVSNKD